MTLIFQFFGGFSFGWLITIKIHWPPGDIFITFYGCSFFQDNLNRRMLHQSINTESVYTTVTDTTVLLLIQNTGTYRVSSSLRIQDISCSLSRNLSGIVPSPPEPTKLFSAWPHPAGVAPVRFSASLSHISPIEFANSNGKSKFLPLGCRQERSIFIASLHFYSKLIMKVKRFCKKSIK